MRNTSVGKTHVAILCEDIMDGKMFKIILHQLKAHDLEVFDPIYFNEEGLHNVIEIQPHIVILSWYTQENIYEVIESLKRTNPAVKIITHSDLYKEGVVQQLKAMGIIATFEIPGDPLKIGVTVLALHKQRQQGN